MNRQRIWEIVEIAKKGDKASKVFDSFILSLILLNVAVIIVGTVRDIGEQYAVPIDWFNGISVLIFSVEYVLRVWACTADPRYQHPVTGRLRFMFSPLMLLDLLAILPFFLPFLSESQAAFMRVFRLLRIFRMTHLSRYSSSLRLLGRVVHNSREELVLTTVMLTLVLLMASSLLYFLEHPYNPKAFPDIPSTMWWGIITLTTIGYGDLVPITTAGKVLTSIIAVLGIGMFALPAGILGSGFVEELAKRRRKEEAAQQAFCPHCGKPLDHED